MVEELRYLALGDSYTISESVAVSERWPVQLTRLIREQGVKISEPEIVARTGWTTTQLAAEINIRSPKGPFDIVTLMIGVNNQFRGFDLGDYRAEFSNLLDTAVALAGGELANVIVISIPDYGVTPFAAGLDDDLIAREIDLFTSVNQEEAIKAGVAYVDVTSISRQAKTDLSLVAADGLHPSGNMYGRWAEVIHSEIASRVDAVPKFVPTIQPTLTPTPMPTATVVPTPTPSPTATPTPTVEPCRINYPTPIVSGPSVPNRPQDGDRVFRSLTVHPTNPDIVLLGTERNGFMWSGDGGVTWSRYRSGLRSDPSGYSEIWDIDFSLSNPDIIMAATLDSPGPPYGPDVAAGLYRSSDGSKTWTQLNCGFTTSRVVTIRIDPSDPEVAVAGLEGGWPSFTGPGDDRYYPGGIYRTEDGGQNWTKVSVGAKDERNGYVIMRMIQSGQLVTFGINGEDLNENLGFMRSNDMGRTWEFFAPELRTRNISGFDLSTDGQTIYANEDGTYSGRVSKDAGATWSQGPILQVNGPVAVSPADSNLVIFGSFGDLRRSTDGLASMSVVMPDPETVREIVFSRSNPNVVYAETDGYILYRSDDAGLTWRLLVNGREQVLNAQP